MLLLQLAGPRGLPSFITLEASDGGFCVLFTNLLEKHVALFKTFFSPLKTIM